ncbi:hypothetical protein CFC21_069483 [Triticum aestivum]|uniref:DUF4220 domain-containing protein n=2 Tax=Triticum aestivum TaxID=4565 RepID=A0A3B6LF18_WHEAT|nr:hypothetical protein CFC21_069483 [Triticum aestivum]
MARRLMDLWNEWEIQILVLVSYTLQVILVALARNRRLQASAVRRLVLWLAYLLADSTGLYAIGHISLSSRLPEHRLVTFWAPFLLLNLGGPDNITAYSLDDNRLWLRHMLTMVVQVLGAAYIVYRSATANGTFVFIASLLMFTVGAVKYGERTWALKRANLESIRSSLNKACGKEYCYAKPKSAKGKIDDEALRMTAHSLFYTICMQALVSSSSATKTGLSEDRVHVMRYSFVWRDMWKMVEMELALMYDILYTKAAVIHTWSGYCIRGLSPLIITTAFLLFQFSGEDGYNKMDVVVTYVSFCGAFILELSSLLGAMGSSWTRARAGQRTWLLCLHRCVNYIKLGNHKRWPSTIGQYNLLHLSTRDTNELGSGAAKKIGLEDWWNKQHNTGKLTSTADVNKLVFKHISRTLENEDSLDVLRKERGRVTLERNGLYDDLHRTIEGEFHGGIITWHIATDVFLCKSKQAKGQDATLIVNAVQTLSNYMMFLLVARPYMLPGLVLQSLYEQTCNGLLDLWHQDGSTDTDCQASSHSSHPNSWSLIYLPKKIFKADDPNSSRLPEREKLAQILLNRNAGSLNDDTARKPGLVLAAQLADKLLAKEMEMDVPDMLDVILGVWVEMLCYAANRCSKDAHARQLNSGGELTTIVWLLTEHAALFPVDESRNCALIE